MHRILMTGLVGMVALVAAQAQSNVAPDDHGPIIVYGRALPQVGTARSGSEGVVGYADFEDRPISRVGELAENVPGLIATQHSGTGKANQYFLRGFNLDHGTDFASFVDGARVNMRSHGHGQRYTDLNFLIPELVERIDYTKGPYHAQQGDFASAGSASFTTKSRLPAPLIKATLGSFGYYRVLAAGSVDVGTGSLLGGVEGTSSNGPWVLDEDLRKFNGLIKYSSGSWSVGLSDTPAGGSRLIRFPYTPSRVAALIGAASSIPISAARLGACPSRSMARSGLRTCRRMQSARDCA